MSTLEWVAVTAALVFLLAWYLSYSASRLDRLHAKVEGALSALDAALVRRAEAADQALEGIDDALEGAAAAVEAVDAGAHQETLVEQAVEEAADRGIVLAVGGQELVQRLARLRQRLHRGIARARRDRREKRSPARESLLESGALPFHKAGKHRRVRFADLMVYKTHQSQRSVAAMEALAAQAQSLQLGYE